MRRSLTRDERRSRDGDAAASEDERLRAQPACAPMADLRDGQRLKVDNLRQSLALARRSFVTDDGPPSPCDAISPALDSRPGECSAQGAEGESSVRRPIQLADDPGRRPGSSAEGGTDELTPSDRRAVLDAEVARRRAGLFADVDDEEELQAKEALVDKVDRWLADEVRFQTRACRSGPRGGNCPPKPRLGGIRNRGGGGLRVCVLVVGTGGNRRRHGSRV